MTQFIKINDTVFSIFKNKNDTIINLMTQFKYKSHKMSKFIKMNVTVFQFLSIKVETIINFNNAKIYYNYI